MSETLKGDRKVSPPNKQERLERIKRAIDEVKDHPGHGEPYQGSSEKAGRHPIKGDTGPALALATLQNRPRHIVEMGTAYGYSTLYLGLGNPDANITTYEFEPRVAEEAQDILDRAGLDAQVIPGTVEGNTDLLAVKEPIDFVFIDHNKASYLPDFQAIEQHLAPGAVILADNVIDRAEECSDFVGYMVDRYGAEVVPTEAGLLVARVPEL